MRGRFSPVPPPAPIEGSARPRPDHRLREASRPLRLHPGLRRGQTLTDRDHVDDVPGQASTSAVTTVPLRENADGRHPAGSSRSTKGLMNPAARRPIRVRTSRSRPSSSAASSDAGCAGTMRRDGRTRIGRVVQEARDPWQSGCCRRGDGIRVFAEEDVGPMRRNPTKHSIHLIAIRKRRPAADRRPRDRGRASRLSSSSPPRAWSYGSRSCG